MKLFSTSIIGTTGVNAFRVVLPTETQIFAVGGVDVANIEEWKNAGIDGFGIGSAVYQLGKSIDVVSESARNFVKAYDQAVKKG